MNDAEKVKMNIHIGGETFSLTVDFDRQDAVRNAEKSTDDLYKSWRARWPARTDKEIMAMVAYQYASFYQELLDRVEAASQLALETEATLGDILNPPGNDPDGSDSPGS